jgi:hypothetical protein
MTKLEKAFAEASKLPKEEQEVFATWILEEIASERQWNQQFHDSRDRLSALADEALQELNEGRSDKLDPEKL